MFSIGAPSTPPPHDLSLSGADRTATPAQAHPSSQSGALALPPSVSVENYTFHTGRVMTALSDLEGRLLSCAFHPDTPKELFGSLNGNLLTFAIGAKDYPAPAHLPAEQSERMLVTCVLDPFLNLERVIIADLHEQVYCHARCEPSAMAAPAVGEPGSAPLVAETAARPGASIRPAFSPSAAPEGAVGTQPLALAQNSRSRRGGSPRWPPPTSPALPQLLPA